jgi:hypothetical protein
MKAYGAMEIVLPEVLNSEVNGDNGQLHAPLTSKTSTTQTAVYRLISEEREFPASVERRSHIVQTVARHSPVLHRHLNVGNYG